MILSILYVILSGIALPVGGIQMQYLWRNQLGDVYSLGLGSAACLGAAAATMSGWCSLTVGSFICTLICTLVCFLVTLKVNTQSLITFGLLFGTFIGSLGTIVVTNAPNGDLLRQYYLWGAANFRLEGVTGWDVAFSLALFVVGIPLVYSVQRFPVPGFCKYICPAGTFEGAMGLLANPANTEKLSNLRTHRFHFSRRAEPQPADLQEQRHT